MWYEGYKPTVLASQANWQFALENTPVQKFEEYTIYSDANFVGSKTEFGPYTILNTVPYPWGPGVVNEPLVLRIASRLIPKRFCSPDDVPDPRSAGSNAGYHGGTLEDEVAALLSLLYGVRTQVGQLTRSFTPGEDPFGVPAAGRSNRRGKPTVWAQQIASIPIGEHNNHVHFVHNLILPTASGQRSLEDEKSIAILRSLPAIPASSYVNLVRSCMLYQNALWVAETEPNFAWLMLCSSIETAANDFSQASGSPEERLRESKPDLVEMIEASSCPELIVKIAEKIEHSLGATKKFINFITHFIPDEPKSRPQSAMQIDWSTSGFKKILNKVYSYRSRALHGGVPFPRPMLDPPVKTEYGYDEKPDIGIAIHSYGGSWVQADCPINLHAFSYLVRGCLLNWWSSFVV